MLEQEQTHNEQEVDPAEVTPVTELQPAVEAQPQVTAAPPAASFEALTGQQQETALAPTAQPEVAAADAETEKAKPLGNKDAVIEQLAHGMVDKELDDKDEEFCAANSYRALPIIRGKHEFVMRVFLPTEAGVEPIVAFRGTRPNKLQTVWADLDPEGIGYAYHYMANKDLITGQMMGASKHGKVISSGHSLGGALAQINAAQFPDLVSRIVTFQAPGVSREIAQRIVDYNQANPEDAIESTHHRVEGDAVPYGGQALTPGLIHNHRMTSGNLLQRNPLTKHVEMPLAQEELAQGNDVPIHSDHRFEPTTTITTDQDNAEKTQLVENLRWGVGKVAYGTAGAVRAVGNGLKKVGEVITSPFRRDRGEQGQDQEHQ
jgi:hypothetical protein